MFARFNEVFRGVFSLLQCLVGVCRGICGCIRVVVVSQFFVGYFEVLLQPSCFDFA